MNPDEVVRLIVIVSLVVVPSLGITARFALKPIVDALLRLKEGGVLPGQDPGTATELRLLREEMADLQHSVRQLREADSFHRALAEPAAPQIAPRAGE